MPISKSRVAALFLQAGGDDPEQDNAPAEQESDVTPGLFIDLSAFFLAVDAYGKLKGETDPHLKKVVTLLYRYQGTMVDGLEKFFVPLVEDPAFARFRSRLHLAVRRTRGLGQLTLQVEVLVAMLHALHSKPTILREILPDSRAYMAAVKLANLVANDAPETILNGLATLPPASRLSVTRKWIREAATAASVAPSVMESTLADASAAHDIGEDIHKVEVELASTDPVSPAAADLHDKKRGLLDQVGAVADTSHNPAVVLSAAAATANKPIDYATATGRKQRLSPDQEQAMLLTGKGVIAAGAGSGKTRVLASKVVYHINELGVPPTSVMATSFSKKSAAELIKRIEDFGADIPPAAEAGFGTTHSIAAKLMREYGGGNNRGGFLKQYETSSLVRIAMAQVQMRATPLPAPPPPVSLFAGLVPGAAPTPNAPPNQAQVGLSFREACQMAFDRRNRIGNSFLVSFISALFNPNDQFYRGNMVKTRNLVDPRGLTEKQQDILIQVFQRAGVEYRTETDPVLNGGPRRNAAKKDKNKSLRDKYPSFSRPAGQWFNLGLKLEEEDGQGNKKPIPPGTFSRAITKWKGKAVSPSEAWAEGQSDEAAVYAAYEYLKGPNGEADFQNKGDFDDGLLDCSKMMLSSPRALQQIQSRFKVVLVDESQDLNRAQHLMFGLISGFVDPAKATKIGTAKSMKDVAKSDGSMTANTYVFIGDDKQAIYEFRSADPEAFIDMSDLVEGGAGFKTKLLKTNYRSGKMIIEAANRLIAHNSRQIPMVCDANPTRANPGGIEIVPFPPQGGSDMEAPAEWLASKIAEDMELGQAGKKGYDGYGVGLRSNAEAYAYGIELLKKGIPFRSKANFFKDPSAKAMLCWLTIADEGLNGNVDRINEAVLGARAAPATMLGEKFIEKLSSMATGNYLTWLSDNWDQIYGSYGDWSSKVEGYKENLLRIAGLKGQKPEMVLGDILDLTGFDGQSLQDALVAKIEGDEDRLEELRKESADGKVSEEALKEAAFAPIKPLKKLMESRADLTESMKYVRQLQAANEKLTADDDPDAKGFNEPAVTLGTMHSWKGLEVENMFIPFVGGRFPRPGPEEEIASERRLAYVAVTRGENNVYVMDIPTIRPGKPGQPSIIQKSQFVSEMCIPTRGAKAPVTPTVKLGSLSPFDPAAIEAYLRGDENPLQEEVV